MSHRLIFKCIPKTENGFGGYGVVDAKKFGAFISERRKEQHMTQAGLAGKIGVTDKAVSRWERGVSHS